MWVRIVRMPHQTGPGGATGETNQDVAERNSLQRPRNDEATQDAPAARAATRLRDFAASLGLSPTTVSRALDNYPDVSPTTRARVQEAARTAGYRPDPAARRLRRGRPEAVGVVLPAARGRIGPPVFLEMLGRTAERLAEEGLDLLLLPSTDELGEAASFRRLLDGGRVDAMLVLRTRRQDPRVALLHERGIPFVCHGRTENGIEHGFLDGDGTAGFRAATLDLVERGHRVIGHLAAAYAYTFAQLRREGWRTALEEADLPPGPEAEAEPTEASGLLAAERLLDATPRPTALVCATDAIAMGAIVAARRLGLAPGRDISILGHDNLAAGAFLDPPLSTMEIEAPDAGGLLAELLLGRLAGAPVHSLQHVLPLRQIVRGTTGPGPGGAPHSATPTTRRTEEAR